MHANLAALLRRYRPLLAQIASFAWVGILATGAHFATLALVVERGIAGPVVASTLGAVVGAVVSYVLNRAFTFESTRSHAGAVPRFMVVALVSFILNGALMDLLVHRLGVFYLLAQVITTAVTMLWTFSGYRVWAFAHRAGARRT
ncbi:GtrA family protein [Xanthobacter sp. V0B-10]|uniref:GtrA family protein n=1 Tax=Xanthobacter albus TaxID=3119929 RepID=UPI003727AFC9